MKEKAIILMITILYLSSSNTTTFESLVIGVSDGDTLTLLSADKKQTKIRLDSIDAPEKKQPFGNVAKKALSDKVYKKQVIVESSKIDKYGRTVGTVWVDGLLVNLEMVKTGIAWVYRKYATNQAYYSAEEIAKNNKIGLWSQPNPVPPWEFRHPVNNNPPIAIVINIPSSETFSRSDKNSYCKSMKSCAEAIYYLKECGAKKLDMDGDGLPCENLCK